MGETLPTLFTKGWADERDQIGINILANDRIVMAARKNLHKTTKIPVDDDYVALVGKAFYVFSYYEWTIIYTIENLRRRAGYVNLCTRGHKKPNNVVEKKTSGTIQLDLVKAIKDPGISLTPSLRKELKKNAKNFIDLVTDRNTIAHAHPITDVNGDQILNYQGSSKKRPEMKWTKTELKAFIKRVDEYQSLASKCHIAVKDAKNST